MNLKYLISLIYFVGVLHNSYAYSDDLMAMGNDTLERGILPDCTFHEDDVSLHVYTRDHKNGIILTKHNLMNSEIFNKPISHEVFFLVHGFISTMKADNFVRMSKVLIEKKTCLVIGVDWNKGACQGLSNPLNLAGYSQAVKNTRLVGKYISCVIKKLIENNKISISNIRLIGHSLGAHISGFAGKEIQKTKFGKINHIVGLDPAGPSFNGKNCPDRLCVTDAEYVQILHTSNWFGTYEQIGSVDFYINKGKNQNSCFKEPVCSHTRAVIFFTECIVRDCCLIGTPWTVGQSSSTALPLSKCTKQTCVCVGLNANHYPAKGSFYVTTASRSPYCYSQGLKNEL